MRNLRLFLKSLNSKIKSDFDHAWYSFKRWAKIKYSEFLKWGYEKLTIMLVPHSEKKIWTIHVSNFTLLFLSVILIIAIVTSVVSVSNKKTTDQKLIRLEKQNRIKEEYISKFIGNVHLLQNRFASFRSDINRVLSLTTIGRNIEEISDFPSVSRNQEESTNNLDQNLSELIEAKPKEIDYLYELKKEIEIYKIQMQKFVVFVESSKEVLRNIPSIWPVGNGFGHITSKFGYRRDPFSRVVKFHSGVDIAHWPGTPVIAAADGVVVSTEYSGGYGRVVKIAHKYGFTTVYAHLMRSYVVPGQKVKKGDIIGAMGNSGRATGYHLHYEVRIGTEIVDPIPFLSIRFF